MTEPLLYTAKEAAALLSVTPNWLEERVAAQAIPHTRIGRYVRFSRADLEQLIAESAKAPVKYRLRSTA